MELDDAIHTAILTLKEGLVFLLNSVYVFLYFRTLRFYCVFSYWDNSFEGEISSKNIEIGKIGADKVFR